MILENNYKKEVTELIHFIRTPLASIKIGGEILLDNLPNIIQFYLNSSRRENTNVNSLNDDKIEKLILILKNIITEANRISDYIKNVEI